MTPARVRRHLAALLFFAVAVVTAFRVAATPSPIYASDEYAYLKHGADFGERDGHATLTRDPELQQLSNHLFLGLLGGLGALLADPTPAIRVLNFLAYFVGVAWLGLCLLRRTGPPGSSGWFVAALAVLPSGAYVLSPMPEVLLMAGYTAAAVGTVLLLPGSPLRAATFGGVTLGLLLYVKPHAVAPAVAFGLYFTVHSRLCANDWKRRVAPLAYVLALCAAVVTVNALLLGEPALAPTFIGEHYVSGVRHAGVAGVSQRSLTTAARLAVMHGVVLAALFPLSIVAIAHAARRVRGRQPLEPADHLALLTLLTVLACIAMAAWYISGLDPAKPLNGNRLHGRYLTVAFPSLLMLGARVATASRNGVRARRGLGPWALLIAYVLAAAATLYVTAGLRLFPWDYAELFALYAPNSSWSWRPPPGLRELSIALAGAAIVVCAARPQWMARTAAIAQIVFLGASLVAVTTWQEAHARDQLPLSDAGRALRIGLGPEVDDLLLVCPDRFADASYVLDGLRGRPWIRTLAPGGDITAEIVPAGVTRIATLGDYTVRVPYRTYEQYGPLELYGLGFGAVRQHVVPPPPWSQREFSVRVSAPDGGSGLIGFNPPEPWGAWAATGTAIVALPYRVDGAVRLRFQAWVLRDEGTPMRLALGSSELALVARSVPSHFDVTLQVPYPTDRLLVHYPARRPRPWERRMGVALSDVTFSAP